jgi:FLVCR family MFS transporter 7
MAPAAETLGGAHATEKHQEHQEIQAAPTNNTTAVPADDKAAAEPAPGGWTFLKTMKMRGLKGRSSGSATTSIAAAASNASNRPARGIDGQDHDELKVIQSNGSGDGHDRIGEVDILHEVRSDDELLGGDGRGSAAGHAGTQREGINGGSQGADGAGGRVYKVYKRRWFGLVQLVLLNIIVSWDVSRLSKVQPASGLH